MLYRAMFLLFTCVFPCGFSILSHYYVGVFFLKTCFMCGFDLIVCNSSLDFCGCFVDGIRFWNLIDFF